jgi:hypothetical protein
MVRAPLSRGALTTGTSAVKPSLLRSHIAIGTRFLLSGFASASQRRHTAPSIRAFRNDSFEPTSSRMGSRPGEASVAAHPAALL